MTGIRLSGLVSGLDTESIVNQLMAIERLPRTRVENNQAAVQARQSNLRDAITKLTNVKLAAADLRSVGVWADTQDVTSTDTTKVTARATGGIGPGAYEVTVTQLASAARRTYDYQAPTADGQIEIHDKDGNLRTKVDVKSGASIDEVVGLINGKAETGVFAVNINGDLVLASRTTGEDSAFTAVGVGTQTSAVDGQNALFRVGTDDCERQSNVVTDALPGVELTLKGKTASTFVVVGGPAPDHDAVKSKVKDFITAYNSMVTALRADLNEKRVANPQNATDASKGSLFGDLGISAILTDLRGVIGNDVPGMTDVKSLADIGVSTGAPNAAATASSDSVKGLLTLDEDKLDAAINKNPVAVQKLLGGVIGTDGFAQAIEARIEPLTRAGGLLNQRITSADTEIKNIRDALDRFDARMDSKEQYYRSQFTALEQALSQSQSVQSSLASRLSAMSSS